MKVLPKIVTSLFIGSILTYLLFLFGSQPRSGPSPLFLILFIPFQILANLITKDRATSEFVYYGLQILFYGGASHLILCFFKQNQELTKKQNKFSIIALGSNLGDSPQILREAMTRLQSFSGAPILKSALWQTSPVNCPPGSPKFLNAVVGFLPQPDETPESLLAKMQKLETVFGRQPKKILNEPRPLDLDLIAFGREIRSTPELTLPHPRAHERRFVLQPLSEIMPDLILPGQTRTVAQLLARLGDGERCVKVDGTLA